MATCVCLCMCLCVYAYVSVCLCVYVSVCLCLMSEIRPTQSLLVMSTDRKQLTALLHLFWGVYTSPTELPSDIPSRAPSHHPGWHDHLGLAPWSLIPAIYIISGSNIGPDTTVVLRLGLSSLPMSLWGKSSNLHLLERIEHSPRQATSRLDMFC